MHPKSSFGFGTHFLQFLHRLLVSSLKNSINTPHEGHLTSKISPGFQWRVSCPGHFMLCTLPFFPAIFKMDIQAFPIPLLEKVLEMLPMDIQSCQGIRTVFPNFFL
jgi:hypothetical protein